jgi:phage recombination protein Bet
MKDAMIEYKPQGSETAVKLSPSIVRRYLVSGDGEVSDQEVTMFMQLCRFQGLNPYLREAHLIKYGSSPATIVVGKDAFTRRAEAHPDFRGMVAGVIIAKEDGLEYRAGSLVLAGEKLVGGWAKVYKANRDTPYEISVGYHEYEGRKRDGTPNRQWSEKPATMIRKVALVQGLREAFPDSLGGLYDASEMSHIDGAALPEKVVSPQRLAPDDPSLPSVGEVECFYPDDTDKASGTPKQEEIF